VNVFIPKVGGRFRVLKPWSCETVPTAWPKKTEFESRQINLGVGAIVQIEGAHLGGKCGDYFRMSERKGKTRQGKPFTVTVGQMNTMDVEPISRTSREGASWSTGVQDLLREGKAVRVYPPGYSKNGLLLVPWTASECGLHSKRGVVLPRRRGAIELRVPVETAKGLDRGVVLTTTLLGNSTKRGWWAHVTSIIAYVANVEEELAHLASNIETVDLR